METLTPLLSSSEALHTCAHWGVCGGCSLLDMRLTPPRPFDYAEELRYKEGLVQKFLAPFDAGEWRSIVGSPETWYYRNKMEYAFGMTETGYRRSGEPVKEETALSDTSTPPLANTADSPVLLGLRKANRFNTIVDVETCLLMSPEAERLLHIARAWARSAGFSGYNRLAFKGDLRYLVLREAKNTGERLGIMIASSHLKEQLLSANGVFQSFMDEARPLLSTFYLAFTDKSGDVARTNDMHLLWGPGTITERLHHIRYRISPYSFFQTNTRGTERLHSLLLDWAKTLGGGALVDLYCGSGAIGLALSSGFDRVVGIDTNKEAIADAQFNATQNGITHTEFVHEDAQDFLKKLPGSKLSVQMSALVIDPPRPGLHVKALKALLEINPPRIAYISCNPESLARDLQSLVPFYKIATVQPVDLFPHTSHVETIVALEHR